ncbi:hypothetical protein [uncultured Lutibacter sp.]|uniref:hypothetical protein n=1 Tax=uncultured Lutibacter sp. TaxID=437739 RepID=UPI0026324F03|nr:hypothetical protein [uncultured Lutibacter sp.]
MKNYLIKYSVILVFIGFVLNTKSFAQETTVKDYKFSFKFNTIKQPDNSRLLEVNFIATNKKDRKDKVPIYQAEIKFYNFTEEEKVLLNTVKTNDEGIAQLIIPKSKSFLQDENGYINLSAVFEETDAISGYEKEITVKDIFLELNLLEIDSVKTANIKAYTIDSIGEKIDVEEEIDLIFSVAGMLSKMPINEGTLENGTYEFEFPTDIPGNINGNLDVFVLVDDHDEFGSIIQKKSVNWGVFNNKIIENNNTLWSESAPIWMYIVLTILLVGIWANFIYTIVNLIKIKNEGKELELAKED